MGFRAPPLPDCSGTRSSGRRSRTGRSVSSSSARQGDLCSEAACGSFGECERSAVEVGLLIDQGESQDRAGARCVCSARESLRKVGPPAVGFLAQTTSLLTALWLLALLFLVAAAAAGALRPRAATS
jgi:preprotein translocase subunit SecG